MLACKVVCCSHQSDHRSRVCISHQSDFRIKLCISHQSYITVFGYLVPIIVFGYCFLANNVTESGGRAQRMTLT